MRKIFFILLCGYWLNLTAETNEPPISLHFTDVKDHYYIHNNPLSIKLQTHINNKSLITEPVDLWVNIQMPITPNTKVDLFINAGGINGNPEPFKKNITVSDLTDTLLEMPAIPASIPAGKYVFSAYYSKAGSAFSPQTASLSNWAIAEIRVSSHLNGFDADPRPQNTTCIAPARSAIPSKLSETGCITINKGKIKPAAGVIPYNVNLMFWSDGAFKERWMAIPADTNITINKEGHWIFPIGSIIFKHFYLQDKIFETRLLIHHDDNLWAGYSYEWNADGLDATLVQGEKHKQINAQTWIYPSGEQCLECHTKNAGDVLGLETRQMNRLHHYSSTNRTSSQIDTLINLNILKIDENKYDQINLPQPTYNMPLEQRARAYLHTNCSYCHRPGGEGKHDFRITADFSDHCYKPSNPPQFHMITAGDPEHSLMSQRMHKGEMPPLGSTVINQEGVQLIDEWISTLTDCSIPPTPSCPPLSLIDFKQTKKIYFDKCARCHGELRQGGTGKPLLPENIVKLGIEKTKHVIFYGVAGGMPAWGENGTLTQEQIDKMACYLQYPVTFKDEE